MPFDTVKNNVVVLFWEKCVSKSSGKWKKEMKAIEKQHTLNENGLSYEENEYKHFCRELIFYKFWKRKHNYVSNSAWK